MRPPKGEPIGKHQPRDLLRIVISGFATPTGNGYTELVGLYTTSKAHEQRVCPFAVVAEMWRLFLCPNAGRIYKTEVLI